MVLKKSLAREVRQAFNPSTGEAEAGESLEFLAKPGLQSK